MKGGCVPVLLHLEMAGDIPASNSFMESWRWHLEREARFLEGHQPQEPKGNRWCGLGTQCIHPRALEGRDDTQAKGGAPSSVVLLGLRLMGSV